MADHDDSSLYHAVRRAQPGLVPHIVSKPTVLALSRHIERSIFESRDSNGVLFGLFQEDRHFRASQDIWEALADRVASTVVFTADQATSTARGISRVVAAGPSSVPNEWAILHCTPNTGSAVIASEVARAGPSDSQRRFETVRLSERTIVRISAEVAAALAASRAPGIEETFPEWFVSSRGRQGLT